MVSVKKMRRYYSDSSNSSDNDSEQESWPYGYISVFVKSVDNQTNYTKAEVIESNTDSLNTTAPINSVNRNYKLIKDVAKGDVLHTTVCAIPKYR